MNETEKRIHLEKFEKDVNWLRRAVPPDDIYDFAEQTLMACDYFIYKLNELNDLIEEGSKDQLLDGWLKNVMGVRLLKDQGYKGTIQVSMGLVYEDNHSRESSPANKDET